MRNQISPYHELGLQDAKIERLRSAIREIEGIADDAADVDDGRPNNAMRVLAIARAALAGA
jgi:hypothetical protein